MPDGTEYRPLRRFVAIPLQKAEYISPETVLPLRVRRSLFPLLLSMKRGFSAIPASVQSGPATVLYRQRHTIALYWVYCRSAAFPRGYQYEKKGGNHRTA